MHRSLKKIHISTSVAVVLPGGKQIYGVENLQSFRNWPLEINNVPSVRKPSNASFPCCLAVSLSTGAPGSAAFPPSMCCDCQIKSCSKFPSFLDSKSCLACSTMSRKSATKAWPSVESFLDGLASGRDLRKLLSAISICSFCATQTCQRLPRLRAYTFGIGRTYRWDFTSLEC